MDLEGKVVVITGGGAGIGAAMARAMANANARHVVVTDINFDNAQAIANEVNGSAKMVDVANEEQIIELGYFIGFTMGQQRFNRLLNLDEHLGKTGFENIN